GFLIAHAAFAFKPSSCRNSPRNRPVVAWTGAVESVFPDQAAVVLARRSQFRSLLQPAVRRLPAGAAAPACAARAAPGAGHTAGRGAAVPGFLVSALQPPAGSARRAAVFSRLSAGSAAAFHQLGAC